MTAVAVDESFADVANVPVVNVKDAEPEAVATTADALAPVVSPPRVLLFVPFPKGMRSRKSGTLKVVVPLPAPYVVPITANKRAKVVLEMAESSQSL